MMWLRRTRNAVSRLRQVSRWTACYRGLREPGCSDACDNEETVGPRWPAGFFLIAHDGFALVAGAGQELTWSKTGMARQNRQDAPLAHVDLHQDLHRLLIFLNDHDTWVVGRSLRG